MKQKLKILIIIGITVLVIIVFIVLGIVNLSSGPAQNGGTHDRPTPTTAFLENELYITSIKPSDTTKTYTPAQPIEISFTQPVDKLALKYTVEPPSDTFVAEGESPNTLRIVPTTLWNNGTTSIRISDDTVSAERKTLKNPKVYILKTTIPTVPENLQGAY